MSGRDRILGRVREALQGRENPEHPGHFEGWRPEAVARAPVEQLTSMLEAAGAEVVRHSGTNSAGVWLRRFAFDFESATIGVTVPHVLRPAISARGAHEAALGVSMARAAIAETGSLVMSARDGRRSQLLCHLGNIAQRTTGVVQCDPQTGRIVDDPEAMMLWGRDYEPGWEPEV